MDAYLTVQDLMVLVSILVVALSAASRFNSPVPQHRELSSLMDRLREPFRLSQAQGEGMPLPARAATTAFKYRVHQAAYVALGVMLYLFVYQFEEVRNQLTTILTSGQQGENSIPYLGESGALVIAAFVILILPNIPPFRWADMAVRRALYQRAAIPAQQWRECSRLKHARYQPADALLARIKQQAVADGFNMEDLRYDPDIPKTQSLWMKCLCLMQQIGQLEADDHYKTAFAVLREEDGKQRSVDLLREDYLALKTDARLCLAVLRDPQQSDQDAADARERLFRQRTKLLLMRIYHFLSRVSLHAHYSDRERIESFGRLGFVLKPKVIAPLPDLNDLVALGVLLALVLVLPLASGPLGLTGAVMVAFIMYSAVLTPVLLARVCPALTRHDQAHHTPLIAYPVVSGVVAALLGALILSLGGALIGQTSSCEFSGWARYTNCSYPWSYLHAGMASLLAWRMSVGRYPDVSLQATSFKRLQRWMNPVDGVICMVGLSAIFLLATEPALVQLRGDAYTMSWGRVLRVGILGLVMGALVPTWFRGYGQRRQTERRTDSAQRARFAANLHQLQPERPLMGCEGFQPNPPAFRDSRT